MTTIEERYNYLNTILGTPRTPEQVLHRYLELGRGNGKTTVMINSLDENSVVITCSEANAKLLKETIKRDRNIDVRVISVQVPNDCQTILDLFEVYENNVKLQGISSLTILSFIN